MSLSGVTAVDKQTKTRFTCLATHTRLHPIIRSMAQVVQNGTVGDWRLRDEVFLASFHLPSDEQKADVLQRRNPFPRESRIVFQEDVHKYHVDGMEVPRSVTGFLHAYAASFDPQQAISCMRGGRNWATKQQEFVKGDGEIMTDDEITARWQSNGHVQRSRGTLLHFHAEQEAQSFNKKPVP